jgi:hypothetical protein
MAYLGNEANQLIFGAASIWEVAVKRGLDRPAISVGRTQELLHELEGIFAEAGASASGPWGSSQVVLDSPLAADSTRGYGQPRRPRPHGQLSRPQPAARRGAGG